MKKATKKWRIEKAREIIDRNKIDVLFPDEDVYEFSEVCQVEIQAAVRKINPQFKSDPRHLHTLIDGVWDARSWRKFITSLTPEQECKRVMRHVVWDDMRDFLSSVSPKQCQFCKSEYDITVDHVSPPFDEIANDFIAEFGLPKVIGSPDPSIVVNIFEDGEAEYQWAQFHAERAVYQLLCRSCNASKGKRPC